MSDNNPTVASIVLDSALDKPLDYLIPEELYGKIVKGMRVEIPVRGKTCQGTVFEIKKQSEFPHLKPIIKPLGSSEALTSDLFELAKWMAKYYGAPLHLVMRSMLPINVRKDTGHKEQLFVTRAKTREELQEAIPLIRQRAPAQATLLEVMLQATKGLLLTQLLEEADANRSSLDSLVEKGFLHLHKVKIDRSPLENEEYFLTKPKILTGEQKVALDKIVADIEANNFRTHLLYGVTGSGKTEVYLQAIDKALVENKTAIMMVPEIALTMQTIERFRCRFQDKIAVLHHRLSDGERHDAWHSIRNGEVKIVIGARSAIFCPIQNLGLIIVDEEHENSYKQNEHMPCYNARDAAVMRGKICNATVVLGSATPSLESYHNAKKGKYLLSQLTARADTAKLPKVTIVDLRKEYDKAKGPTSFSELLLDGIAKRMEKGEQAILFLNRRGYHSMLLCKNCGVTVKCPHCETSLTFHLGENSLSCHLCGYALAPPPRNCPSCKSDETMKFRGVGTEHVERALHAIFPQVRTLRVDADTTRHKGSHQKLLRDFGTGKADVLIGTQMIAKGLHFPEVTLVGVLNCDSSLNIPDFRASENTFQLLSQVAGRAGRGVVEGEVIIQTALPEHSVVQYAAKHNFEAFFHEELASREIFGYPPFSQLVKIVFSGEDAQKVTHFAETMRTEMERCLPKTYQLLPVLPAGHAKIKDRYRFQFLIRGIGVMPVVAIYHQTMARMNPRKISVVIDVNPYSTFF